MSKPSIVLTGATKGLGLKTCQYLLEKNYSVYALGRNLGSLPKHPHCHPLFCDLSQDSSLKQVIKTLKTLKEVEGLFLFAGVGHFQSLESLSSQHIQEMIQVNFTSQVMLTKALIPSFKQQNKGCVLIMGSEAALQGQKWGSIYCSTKFALRGFAQSLRKECHTHGIKVSLINPGMINTSFYDKLSFKPGPSERHHIPIHDILSCINWILNSGPGTHIDEVNIQPMTKVIAKKD